MLAFLGGASAAVAGAGTPLLIPQAVAPTAPRAQQTFGAAAAEGAATGGASGENGSGVLAAQVAALAAVWGSLAAARRRGSRRSRVALGPMGGNYYWREYTFRAKPGDKYKYKFSTDRWMPEFGVLPEAPDRVVRYGRLLNKGTSKAQEYYSQRRSALADESSRSSGLRGCLLLDCDGTIVETERDGHRVAFNQAFKEKGYDVEWDVDLYGELLTTGGGKERMTRYFTDYNAEAWKFDDPPSKDHPEIVELHKLKTKLFMGIVRSGALPLREGILELVSEASEAGWEIGVCSTSNEEAVETVVQTMLPEFADDMLIFAGDVVSKKKPDPEIYNMASQALGVAPMKCVVVEDAAIGCQAGKAAGMQVIVTKSIYSDGEDFAGADMVLGSAEEVSFDQDVAAMLPTLEFA